LPDIVSERYKVQRVKSHLEMRSLMPL